jgi:hypothetical protein
MSQAHTECLAGADSVTPGRPAISLVLYTPKPRRNINVNYLIGLVQTVKRTAELLPGWRVILTADAAALKAGGQTADLIELCLRTWPSVLEVRPLPSDYKGPLMLARYLPLLDDDATIVAARDADNYLAEEDARLLTQMAASGARSLIYREYKMTGCLVAMGGGVALDARQLRDHKAWVEELFAAPKDDVTTRGLDEVRISALLMRLDGIELQPESGLLTETVDQILARDGCAPSCSNTLYTRMLTSGAFYLGPTSNLQKWNDADRAPLLMGLVDRLDAEVAGVSIRFTESAEAIAAGACLMLGMGESIYIGQKRWAR